MARSKGKMYFIQRSCPDGKIYSDNFARKVNFTFKLGVSKNSMVQYYYYVTIKMNFEQG